MTRTIIFDLDGTLCDSLPGVAETIQNVIAAAGLPTPTAEQVRGVIGPPVAVMFQRLLPAATDDEILGFERAFREQYDGGNWAKVEWFRATEETLSNLREKGYRFFIFTNKPEKAARRIVESGPLAQYIEMLLSKDSRSPKYATKSEMLRDLISTNDIDARTAIVVGDGKEDMQAAVDADLPFVFASYGYGTAPRTAITRFAVMNDFQELIEICNRGL